jgi:hypothetical protein
MRIAATAFVALLTLAGCQTANQVSTASGRPEATYAAAPEKVRAVMLNGLINKGFQVKTDTPYLLVVEQPSKNLMVNLLLGSQWNPTVNVRCSYTIVPIEKASTRVVASCAAVTNPGTAYERLTEVNDAKSNQALQGWLNSLTSQV